MKIGELMHALDFGVDWHNGVRQELQIQMALQVKSGLFPIQW